MNSGAAGTGGGYPGFRDKDDNRGDYQAASARGRWYRRGTVSSHNPRGQQLPHPPQPPQPPHSRASCSSAPKSVKHCSVEFPEGFSDLIDQEELNQLKIQSDFQVGKYRGKRHGVYASSVKKYSKRYNRLLNHHEQNKLIPLLQNFEPGAYWNWRSLTTTVHSLTSAGVFTPLEETDQVVKDIQSDLLVALLNAVSEKCKRRHLASDVDARGIANLLWAIAKLVDNGRELIPELKKAVTALLPCVQAKKGEFLPQHTANLLWAMAKLVDKGHERTPALKETVAGLFPCMMVQIEKYNGQDITSLLWAMAKLVDKKEDLTPEIKDVVAGLLSSVMVLNDKFNPKAISTLLWALAKLVDKGHERTPELQETLGMLLPCVKVKKDKFTAQEITNLLWAIAKLVDKEEELTPKIKDSVAALLPLVKIRQAKFTARAIANLLWAMAKLVDSGHERTPEIKKAVAVLLPIVKTMKDKFIAQGIANLLWAMAKQVDTGQERTPELKFAVDGLLPRVKEQKANFTPQQIANQLWAMAKLADSGHKPTPELKEAVTELLPRVKEQKANFTPQEIANLLWALGLLGELLDTEVIDNLPESLVFASDKYRWFTQQELLMSLWGLLVFKARSYLTGYGVQNDTIQQSITDIFTHVQRDSIDTERDKRTIALAANWLGLECPVDAHYLKTTSKRQSSFRAQLQSTFPSLKIKEEQSINSLPPVDLLLPAQRIVVEVQGPYHFVGYDFQTRNGSTLLKIALLQKSGYEVIEIPVNQLDDTDSVQACIEKIKEKIVTIPVDDGSVSLISGGERTGRNLQVHVSTTNTKNQAKIPHIDSLAISAENVSEANSSENQDKLYHDQVEDYARRERILEEKYVTADEQLQSLLLDSSVANIPTIGNTPSRPEYISLICVTDTP